MKQSELGTSVSNSRITRRIPVTIRAKGASSVRITGDFIQWAKEGICMQPNGKDGWTATLNLSPGENRYRLIVDGRLSG